MPMVFTDEMVITRLKIMASYNPDDSMEENREALALFVEKEHKDYLEAWEIRTGRPWNEMTSIEATDLVDKHPSLVRNPGFLSRLLS